jgi:VCBS repeat-containing protein
VQTAHLMIRIEGRDDAPVAVAQTAIAVEAGGVHNATPGTNPTGHVIDAATDVDDAPHNVRVSQARTQVNLIRNGSFEQTSFAGSEGLVLTSIPDWTNPADFVKHANGDTASDGRVWIDLDAWTAIDSLKQTNIGTQSGKTYELQFDLSPRAGAVGTTVQVYWNEQFVGNAYVNGDGWTTATFQVTAVGNDSLRLAELASENDTAGPRIDNVRLYQTGVDQTLQGQYGTLTLNADGYYHYDVDQSNAQVQALRRAEDTLQESFSYTLTDAAGLSSTATLAVTVQGKNDAPELIPDHGCSLARFARLQLRAERQSSGDHHPARAKPQWCCGHQRSALRLVPPAGPGDLGQHRPCGTGTFHWQQWYFGLPAHE